MAKKTTSKNKQPVQEPVVETPAPEPVPQEVQSNEEWMYIGTYARMEGRTGRLVDGTA